MRFFFNLLLIILASAGLTAMGCGSSGGGDQGAGNSNSSSEETLNVIFLHHSTGKVIWDAGVKKWFKKYNKQAGTRYEITEREFPAESPYGWNNYPYDYWNIWVNHAGPDPYQNEPTLEILAKENNLIVFKHCFPVSDIKEDSGSPDVSSSEKTIENYTLQYQALKAKMHEFPGTAFLLWTGAALAREATGEENAARARKFFEWVKNEWDEPGDNIHVWDFFDLETGGGLYLKDEYAESATNSHPKKKFAKTAAPLLCQRIVDVIEGRGDDS